MSLIHLFPFFSGFWSSIGQPSSRTTVNFKKTKIWSSAKNGVFRNSKAITSNIYFATKELLAITYSNERTKKWSLQKDDDSKSILLNSKHFNNYFDVTTFLWLTLICFVITHDSMLDFDICSQALISLDNHHNIPYSELHPLKLSSILLVRFTLNIG